LVPIKSGTSPVATSSLIIENEIIHPHHQSLYISVVKF
jgi:hypothetical protein